MLMSGNGTGVCGEPNQAVGGSSGTNGASGGDYVVNTHEIISSPRSTYEVLELLGLLLRAV